MERERAAVLSTTLAASVRIYGWAGSSWTGWAGDILWQSVLWSTCVVPSRCAAHSGAVQALTSLFGTRAYRFTPAWLKTY